MLTILFLAPPAILLFFAQGVQALLSLPDRLASDAGRRSGAPRGADPARGPDHDRLAPAALPLLLWRLRGAFGSVRDVAGVALPLRVFTPGFLTLAALSALFCVLLPAVVLIALLVVACA